jgi:hypothetical protein
MKITINENWTAVRPRFVAPTLAAAGVTSAQFRAQTASPITGDAGMVMGHRPWSPPIT